MTEDELKKATNFSNPDPNAPWLETRLYNPFTEWVMEAISEKIAEKVIQKMLDHERRHKDGD